MITDALDSKINVEEKQLSKYEAATSELPKDPKVKSEIYESMETGKLSAPHKEGNIDSDVETEYNDIKSVESNVPLV